MRRVPDRISRRQRKERGAALVELALILPILALLMLGVVDFGLILREYQIVQNAAREGSRLSIHPPNWIDPVNPQASPATITARVVEYLQEEGINDVTAANVTVSQAEPIVVGGLTVHGSRVTVTYNRPLLITWPGFLPGPTITLTGTSVFRNLY